jgi:hypothetical protein
VGDSWGKPEVPPERDFYRDNVNNCLYFIPFHIKNEMVLRGSDSDSPKKMMGLNIIRIKIILGRYYYALQLDKKV